VNSEKNVNTVEPVSRNPQTSPYFPRLINRDSQISPVLACLPNTHQPNEIELPHSQPDRKRHDIAQFIQTPVADDCVEVDYPTMLRDTVKRPHDPIKQARSTSEIIVRCAESIKAYLPNERIPSVHNPSDDIRSRCTYLQKDPALWGEIGQSVAQIQIKARLPALNMNHNAMID
jgi:hypothetical protein